MTIRALLSTAAFCLLAFPKFSEAQTPLSPDTMVVCIDKVIGHTGGLIEVPVRVKNFKNIVVAQFCICLDDAASAEISSISYFGPPSLAGLAATIAIYSRKKVCMSWSDPTVFGVSLPDSSVLFTMNIKLSDTLDYCADIYLCENPLPVDVYAQIGSNTVVVPVSPLNGVACSDSISLKSNELIASQSRIAISPNPFYTSAAVSWDLPEGLNFPDETARIRITDETGILIFEKNIPAGEHSTTFEILEKDLPSAGIYFCRLTCGRWHATGKFLKKW